MKLINILILVFGITGCQTILKSENNQSKVACQLDALICPDGSSVGRIPPSCEFETCLSSQEDPANQAQQLPFTAHFEIYTNGLKRDFSNPMYLNQSTDAYISNAQTSTKITVTNSNMTWDEFFQTLPFSISKECLVTGTGQEFCNNGEGKLEFNLNGNLDDQALTKTIFPNDELIIRYE